MDCVDSSKGIFCTRAELGKALTRKPYLASAPHTDSESVSVCSGLTQKSYCEHLPYVQSHSGDTMKI